MGWELARALAPLGHVDQFDRAKVDLTDLALLSTTVRASCPDVIVNAAAYTNVDGAESDPATAMRVNAAAPAALAAEAARSRALMVHFSTDYVFAGKGLRPYVEDDPALPRTVYGASKLRGDEGVMASEAEAYVFRVGWVYAARGRNFLRTIERLARERDELKVVVDQVGTPTWSRAIAEATAQAVGQWLTARRERREAPPRGIYHMAGPDHTTWYGFAASIVEKIELPAGRAAPVVAPILTSEYPTPAPRPAWSVLDSTRLRTCFGLALPPWNAQLVQCVGEDR